MATVGTTLGRLDWGYDPATGKPWTVEAIRTKVSAKPQDLVGKHTSRVLQRAQETLGDEIKAVPALHFEGVLFSDPRYQESVAAVRSLENMYTWAVGARVAEPPLSGQFQQKAEEAVIRWVSTYRPTGNPINESRFVPMLQAIDLLLPTMTSEDREAALAWVEELTSQGDAFFARLRPNDGRLTNNWASWRLLLRAMGATITGDRNLLASTGALVTAHVAANIYPDGSSLDFLGRDALHYHVYNLEALVQIVLYVPGVVDADAAAAIGRAVGFLEPYFTGSKQHIEFVNSPVRFDAERREAGDLAFAQVPWNPKQARQLLLLARARFPEVRTWSESVVDEEYSPRLKHLAALYGSLKPTPSMGTPGP